MNNKYCYFITMHNHVGELSINKDCFNDEKYFTDNLDVVINSNKIDVDRSVIQQIADQYRAKNVHVIFDEKNEGGYYYGCFEQICNSFDILKNYRAVVHTHPDVYPLECFGIKKHLEECDAKNHDAMLFALPNRDSMYAQDFFIFSPTDKVKEAFERWREYSIRPGWVGEMFIYDTFRGYDVGYLDRSPCAGMNTSYEPNMGIVSNPGGMCKQGGDPSVVDYQQMFVGDYLRQKNRTGT